MDLWPGLVIAVVGVLVLLVNGRIAAVFTALQQRDPSSAHPSAGFFQRVNTVLFGAACVAVGLLLIFR